MNDILIKKAQIRNLEQLISSSINKASYFSTGLIRDTGGYASNLSINKSASVTGNFYLEANKFFITQSGISINTSTPDTGINIYYDSLTSPPKLFISTKNSQSEINIGESFFIKNTGNNYQAISTGEYFDFKIGGNKRASLNVAESLYSYSGTMNINGCERSSFQIPITGTGKEYVIYSGSSENKSIASIDYVLYNDDFIKSEKIEFFIGRDYSINNFYYCSNNLRDVFNIESELLQDDVIIRIKKPSFDYNLIAQGTLEVF